MKFNNTVLLVFAYLFPFTLLANIEHAPPKFMSPEGKVIFVDFKTATYDITYDPSTKKSFAVTTIEFENIEEGLPVIEMVENPSSFILDGEEVSTKIINTADKETWLRIVLKKIATGSHKVVITSPIERGVSFVDNGVSSAFWLNDLGDRAFLEVYLPTNFEFDQYKMIFNIDFKSMPNQKIFANGKVSNLGQNKFRVTYPETYTTSSLYFHTAPVGRYYEKTFEFASTDGRLIPSVVYTKNSSANLNDLKSRVESIIHNLEAQYGPWLHDKIIVFLSSEGGGMEYCGATFTDLGSLSHELTHSYFARGGFMPANGNAGWIDEAITTWSDSGSNSRPDLNGVVANMAGNSPYRRWTDSPAYSIGASFMSYFHYRYKDRGGLSSFLNNLIQTNAFVPMTTEEFYTKMSFFYSEDLTELFRDHVFKNKKWINGQDHKRPVHLKLSIEEMREYL